MEQIYTPQEVAVKLRVSYRTILNLIKSGKLEAFRIGAHIRISESAIPRYKESNKQIVPETLAALNRNR
jgi:excisionase family DNA binding protein